MRNKINGLKHEAGFSLLELMTVVGVIGLLASIAIPQFTSLRDKSLDADSLSTLKQLMNHEMQFKLDSFIYPSFGVADKVGSKVDVTVGSKQFVVQSLSPKVELISKISADGQSAILAAKHTGSQTIVAIDLNNAGAIYKLENQAALTDAVIPASTAGNDLSGWVKY